MNKGILEKLKYIYILQLESGLQFETDEKGDGGSSNKKEEKRGINTGDVRIWMVVWLVTARAHV